jgi:hypothetical protein
VAQKPSAQDQAKKVAAKNRAAARGGARTTTLEGRGHLQAKNGAGNRHNPGPHYGTQRG